MSGRASTPLRNAAESIVIALAQTGDPDAFAEIVRRKHNRVRYFMRYLSGQPSDGDDLAQQVFLKAWRSIDQLKSAVAFDAWLKKIMVTTWLEQARRREIVYTTDLDLAEISTHHDSVRESLDLDAALEQLPDAMRLCVVLAYHEGMTHEEITEVTGFPLGTVKSNISRGATKLKKVLCAYAREEDDMHAR